jgi:hypothetical protein
MFPNEAVAGLGALRQGCYNSRRAPVVQRIEQSTPKALMWVQFPPGALAIDRIGEGERVRA